MSRESDLQALKNMKEEIVEIYNLSEQCKKLSDECEELSGKIKSPEPFAFARKPENSAVKPAHVKRDSFYGGFFVSR